MTPHHLRERLVRSLEALRRDDSGGGTIWMMFWSVGFMMIGGLAVDTTKAWRMEAMMRSAADAAAHAAIVDLVAEGEPAARETAIRYAESIMPKTEFGEVLSPSDVEFGRWDVATGTFLASDEPDSVRVTLRRSDRNGNPEPTTLLRLVGQDKWDLTTQAVARVVSSPAQPPEMNDCWLNGLISRKFVRARSNNVFSNICIHGETGTGFNNHNYYENATIVSMPQLDWLVLPGNGFKHNHGLETRLMEDDNDPWIVDHIEEMIEEATGPAEDGRPYATHVPVGSFDVGVLETDRVYWVECGASGTLTIPKDAVLEGLHIMTNCAIHFGRDVVLIDTTIGTTGDAATPGSHTVHTPSGLVIGRDDDCAPGGGSRLLIDGNFHSAAKLSMNSSQIIASSTVQLAAQAMGLDGVSVLAGDDIDITSNNGFGSCDDVDFSVIPPQSSWVGRTGGFALLR